jgi:hypothetical protein
VYIQEYCKVKYVVIEPSVLKYIQYTVIEPTIYIYRYRITIGITYSVVKGVPPVQLLELEAPRALVLGQAAEPVGAVCRRVPSRRRPLEDAILK